MAYSITEACQGCQACVRNCPTKAISGEKHQVHKIDPQRCIECGTCGRVCPYSAVLTPVGEAASRVKRSEWLQPIINQRKCVSCGLCIITCPANCLEMDDHNEHFPSESFPYLKRPSDCLSCRFCEAICPVSAINMRSRSGT